MGRGDAVTRRLAAALLLLLALGLHLGLAAPARRQRDEARAAFAQLREERESLRARAVRLQRRSPSASAPRSGAEAARALRLSFLQAVSGLPLRSVKLSTEAGRHRAEAARGSVAAEGEQADLLRVAGRLALGSSGVLVERARFVTAAGQEVRLEIEAISVTASTDVPNGPAGKAP